MKKLFMTSLILIVTVVSSYAVNYIPNYNSDFLVYDKGLQPVQGFAPDPAKAQVAASVNASATTSITVTGWTAIMFSSTEEVQMYFNADSTKYMQCAGDTRHVFVIRPDVTTIVLKNVGIAAATISVWGM